MKKYIDWEMNPNEKDLEKYLGNFPCEVDEEMFNYFAHVVEPNYLDAGLLQVGESSYEIAGIYYYLTFQEQDDKFWFLGTLPEFKQ